MPALLPRCALFPAVLAAGIALAGCEQISPSAPDRAGAVPAEAPQSSTPQTLTLPDRVLPITAADYPAASGVALDSIAAGFEQSGAYAGGGARIRELSAAAESISPDVIREPTPGVIREPAPVAETVAEPIKLRPTEVPKPSESAPSLRNTPFAPINSSVESSSPTAEASPNFALNSPYAIDSRAQPDPAPALTPTPIPPAAFRPDRAAMQPVAQRAAEISNHAYSLAQRGMLYAARAELIRSLQLVAQALDVQYGSASHDAALAAGLAALKEARDFAALSPRPGAVEEIVRGHQTPVLKSAAEVSPVVAQQQYLAYAQTQLSLAAGQEPVASLTLFRLGKVQMAMAQQDGDSNMLHAPQAMVFYQAALATDRANYLAANELGVLLAGYGQLQQARELLVHSVSIQPHVEGWHNLAVVHRRLGETDLARRADHERQLLAQRSPPAIADTANNIAWVDAKTFAATSRSERPQTASQPNVRGSASIGTTR
ncbi:MAG TPA: hypothetical protein VFV87_04500 [Pirellulaceae bacterium]|nr:hypothetical protein [Pirellulaceae bacterium]